MLDINEIRKRAQQASEKATDAMKKTFENHGFSGFELRHYDDNMEKLLSFAAEDNAKGYVIDVVPGGLQHGENNGIALMEKHYAKPERFRKPVSYTHLTLPTILRV
mgnify:CR=1 FL=1